MLGRKVSTPSTACGGSFGFCRTRHPASCPQLRQGLRIQRDRKRCRTIPTVCSQAVDNRPWRRGHEGLPHGHGRADRVLLSGMPAAGSSMKGTSGTADSGPLRGGAGDAALGGIVGGAALNRRFLAALESPSSEAAITTTRGVRADRVGEKLSSRSPAKATPEERRPSTRGTPLTREHSTGDRPSSWKVRFQPSRLAKVLSPDRKVG